MTDLVKVQFTNRASSEKKFIPKLGMPHEGYECNLNEEDAISLEKQGFLKIVFSKRKPNKKDISEPKAPATSFHVDKLKEE